MKRILTQRIAAPMLMFAPEGAGGSTDIIEEPPEAIDADGKTVKLEPRIEGEEAPNFDEIDPESGSLAEKEEKPPTAPPNAKKEALRDTPLPEIAPEKTDAEKAAEAEAVTKATEEEKAKAAAPAAKVAIPKDDADLDELKLKPGTNPKVGEQFGKAKEQTKLARAAARQLEAEVATIAAQKAELETKLAAVKPLDEPTEKELQELRDFRQQTLLENDPVLVKEFADKTNAIESRIISMLVENGMTQENADKMKAAGLDKYPGKWWKEQIFDKMEDPLEAARLQKLLIDRAGVAEDKRERVAGIAANKDALLTKQTQEREAKFKEFAGKLEAKATELAKGHKWAAPIAVTDTMTAQEKAEAAAHNAQYDTRNKTFMDRLQKVVDQDPAMVAEAAFAIAHRDVLAEENTTLKADAEKQAARISELEDQIAAINKTGQIGSKQGAPPAKRQAAPPPENETAEEALERYEQAAK